MLTELSATTLLRLTTEATFATYHHAPCFRGRFDAVSAMIFSGESSMNYLIFEAAPPRELLGRTITAGQFLAARLDEYVREAGEASFLALFSPEVAAAPGFAAAAAHHGLVKVETMPLMVCEATGFEVARNLDINVTRVADERDWLDFSAPVAAAFKLAETAVQRAMPASLIQHPGIELYLARHTDGSAVAGAVFTTHGDVAGIWTMGTHPAHQGKGYGRVLLTQAMSDHHRRGIAAFYLDATPAGERLYRRIGFRTVAEAEVWGKKLEVES